MNEGNGYDDRTEVFTCPMAGTYMYKYGQFKTQQEKVASLHVNFVNKKYRVPYLQISMTVILKLKVGDHVQVVSGGNDVFITSDNYSGFTGT